MGCGSCKITASLIRCACVRVCVGTHLYVRMSVRALLDLCVRVHMNACVCERWCAGASA